MKVIINAANIHQGGGKTLLVGLLGVLRLPAVVLLDARLQISGALHDNVQVITVQPTIFARFAAELRVSSISHPEDVLICFGNLPPLLKSRARVFVFLQNRYLTSPRPIVGLSRRTRARIMMERLWLRACLRESTIVVQTPSVAEEVRKSLGRSSIVAPFAPPSSVTEPTDGAKEYDFVYVASGEAHKNHRSLIEAWELLAAEGYYPTLRLTLDEAKDSELVTWIANRALASGLRVINGAVAYEAVGDLYGRSRALIYPSLFESFGLPLIEASRAGLPILSVERDYVRDVVTPVECFDPDSALSIARAVLRHMEVRSGLQEILTPDAFLSRILTMA